MDIWLLVFQSATDKRSLNFSAKHRTLLQASTMQRPSSVPQYEYFRLKILRSVRSHRTLCELIHDRAALHALSARGSSGRLRSSSTIAPLTCGDCSEYFLSLIAALIESSIH